MVSGDEVEVVSEVPTVLMEPGEEMTMGWGALRGTVHINGGDYVP